MKLVNFLPSKKGRFFKEPILPFTISPYANFVAGNYVNLGSVGNLWQLGNNVHNFMICVRFKTFSTPNNVYKPIIENGTSTTNGNGHSLGLYNNKVYFTGGRYIETINTYDDNEWHSAVYLYMRNINTSYLFVDDEIVEQTNAPVNHKAASYTYAYILGIMNNGGGLFASSSFLGGISDIQYYYKTSNLNPWTIDDALYYINNHGNKVYDRVGTNILQGHSKVICNLQDNSGTTVETFMNASTTPINHSIIGSTVDFWRP